ncbi:hypothetical protein NSPZN2_50219 [Nitrospira defluvii]|uniref:Uncharacterized protein n=1 Tax=Nitrospira defluvii TaxID=330214 RepID=A0ABN7MA39_9BACT|nr:hypothetical protein NSPZN2_50219 [Nitrospira defluvii]
MGGSRSRSCPVVLSEHQAVCAEADIVSVMELPTVDALFVDEGAGGASQVLQEQHGLHRDDSSMAGRDRDVVQAEIVVLSPSYAEGGAGDFIDSDAALRRTRQKRGK